MPERLGIVLALVLLPMAALSLQPVPVPQDDPPEIVRGLLAGCSDIPEVVALVERLRVREDRIEKALAALDRRRADITDARAMLTKQLSRLKSSGKSGGGSRTHVQRAVEGDIARLVAVYEAMKPKEAAAVLSSLPADFSAELLMRVSPESGARIIAAIDPDKAAVLTTYMGARSAPAR